MFNERNFVIIDNFCALSKEDKEFIECVFSVSFKEDLVIGENITKSGEIIIVKEDATDKITIHDLLTELGIFSSKSQSRKNWNKGGIISDSYNEFLAIGKKRINLYVLKFKTGSCLSEEYENNTTCNHI